MSRLQDAVLTFGIYLACGATVAAAKSWKVLAGFVLGTICTLVSAVLAGTDFE